MTALTRLLTVDDLETLPSDGKRYEIIEGELTVSPAPHMRHQRLITQLITILNTYVEGQDLGWVYPSPVDVRFSLHDQVQPDVIVLLNERESLYRGSTVHGAPDLVVEVISPGSVAYDQKVKFELYERNGVPEYWIADPVSNSLRQFVLRSERYVENEQEGGLLRSESVPGLTIDVPTLFRKLDR